ncbi:MAG TPA: lipocalin family protein [Gemmatimonadaceae bacterium]|nr:lipocalin family protein [Gemmatimonadaceae bacterium]
MLRRVALIALTSFVVLACSDTTTPKDPLLGTWSLVTVSGQPIPYILEQDATRKVELTGETITLLATGRQTMVTSFRVTDHGIVSLENVPSPGKYTVNGSTVTISFDTDPDIYAAIVTGDTMRIDDIGLTFIYRRN